MKWILTEKKLSTWISSLFWANKLGNYLSGNRKGNKKKLVTDCNFIDSYKLTTLYPLDLTINKQYRQQINVTYNDRKRHGGKVKYFECPFCHGRVRFLYIKSNRLACRTCQDLTYESSQCKNQFNFVAKMFSDYGGINPHVAKKIFRPGMKSYW